MLNLILFVQGGGEDVHDQWDNKLVESLRRELGPRYEVRYPLMPNEADPQAETWGIALKRGIDDIEPRSQLGSRLPRGVPVFLYHGDKDEIAPVAHMALYAAAIPHARVREVSNRDHQLNSDLSEVASDIRKLSATSG